jgi:hypothetical protein
MAHIGISAYSQSVQIPIEEGHLKLFFIYSDKLYCSSNQCLINSERVTADTLKFIGWYRMNGKNYKVTEIDYDLTLYIGGFTKYINHLKTFYFPWIDPKSPGNIFLMMVNSVKLQDGTYIHKPLIENIPDLKTQGAETTTDYTKIVNEAVIRAIQNGEKEIFNAEGENYDTLINYHQGPFVIIK